ncbi:hypothetical protein pipiens_006571 [Culex pipiens pipiens]|uniref:Uncharacterized protein n=1 Tax=Culex pipiens pipiens TaxID=38569 RepID=A0ABD1DNZ8_CULPP
MPREPCIIPGSNLPDTTRTGFGASSSNRQTRCVTAKHLQTDAKEFRPRDGVSSPNLQAVHHTRFQSAGQNTTGLRSVLLKPADSVRDSETPAELQRRRDVDFPRKLHAHLPEAVHRRRMVSNEDEFPVGFRPSCNVVGMWTSPGSRTLISPKQSIGAAWCRMKVSSRWASGQAATSSGRGLPWKLHARR